jgi:hypothetical protein
MSDPTVDPAKPFDGHSTPDLAAAIPILTAVAALIPGTADDRAVQIAGGLLANPGTGGLINALFAFIANLFRQRATATAPAPTTQPAPVTTVVTTVTTPATPAPVAAPAAGGDEIKQLVGKLYFVEIPARIAGARGEIEDRDRFQQIQAGANIHRDSWLHTDVKPIADSGTEITTGDPRWASQNHAWSPNGCPVWLYYEFDGQSTLDGHHSDSVEPGSVEDDQGCTPTYKITGPGKFRFGFQYKRHDGTMVDSGLIGQGNVAGGAPFVISQG